MVHSQRTNQLRASRSQICVGRSELIDDQVLSSRAMKGGSQSLLRQASAPVAGDLPHQGGHVKACAVEVDLQHFAFAHRHRLQLTPDG
jgi:hypothetical protein